jgi:hypothetical protein
MSKAILIDLLGQGVFFQCAKAPGCVSPDTQLAQVDIQGHQVSRQDVIDMRIGYFGLYLGCLRPKAIPIKNGAGTKIRTRDLLITNQLLYQLSYTGILVKAAYSNRRDACCEVHIEKKFDSR